MSIIYTGISLGNNDKSTVIYGQSLGGLYTNDCITAAHNTVSIFAANYITRPTLNALNIGVTTTNAISLYITGGPLAGTNQMITNSYSLYIAAGLAYIGGALNYSNFQISGAGATQASAANLYITPQLTTLSGANSYYFTYLTQPQLFGSTTGTSSTLYIAGAPANSAGRSGSSKSFAVNVAQGNSYLGGAVTVGGALITSPIFYINHSAVNEAVKKEVIRYNVKSYIKTSGVSAALDSGPVASGQTYTFGQSTQNMWVAVGAGTNTLAYSTDGLNWIGLGSGIFSTRGFSVAYNGIMWIALGNGTNAMAYSFDGINWIVNTNSPFSLSGRHIIWDGVKWVAVGQGTNTIAYSYDGFTWISATNNFANGYWIAYNGYIYVAVGGDTNTVSIEYSYDGITWTNGSGITYGTYYGITWNGNVWIAVAASANQFSTSSDGINWTTSGSAFTSNGYTIAWNGSVWIAGGDGTNTFAYSYNGSSWTGISGIFTGGQCFGVTWDGTKYLACGAGTNTMAYSYDGITWNGLGSSIFSSDGRYVATNTRRPHTITFPRNLYVAGGGTAGNSLMYSTDGITWNNSTTGTAIFTSGYCNAVAWNGSVWLAGGDNSKLAYSTNGINWTQITTTLIQTHWGFAWNGSIWVAAGAGTTLLAYSYDGFSWVKISTALFTSTAYKVVWNGTMFVAVGDNSKIIYSHNGITWTATPTATTFATWGTDLAWNGTIWIATGGDTNATNRIMYSYDGINWVNTANGSSMFTGASRYARGVAWNGSMWVAVGYGTSQSTAYSYDGINWTNGTNIFASGGMGVSWNGSVWIAVGIDATNRIAYSYDGKTWTGIGSTFATEGKALAWNASTGSAYIQHPAIALGTLGSGQHTIAYSPAGMRWRGLGATIFTIAGYCAAWNGTIWVAGGEGMNTLAWSQDGITWIGLGTTLTGTSPFSTRCRGIVWNGSIWVAVGSGTNTIAWSVDGRTWTVVSAGSGGTLLSEGYGLTQNGSTWVGVGMGPSNYITSSTDGITWTGRGTAGFTTRVNIVIWTGTQWVIGGTGTNIIRYSSDLTTWQTPAALPANVSSCNGIATNGTRLVAGFTVSSGTNTLAYSDNNGVNWTAVSGIFTTAGQAVTWNGRAFIAVGSGTNTIAYSGDGASWTAVSAFPVNSTNSIFPIATGANGISSNSRIGANVVDSQLVLDTSGIGQNNNLELISDTYYDRAITTCTAGFKYSI